MDKTPVTVIGLGSMGSALATTFVRNGHPTTVWNRTAEKADALVAMGAVRADSVEAAISAAPLVVVCVVTNDVVHELLTPVKDGLAGRVVVNLTNGTPGQARDLAAWTAEQGADYLDGGIMAIPPMIGRPEAMLFYSGSQSAYDTHEATLEILGAAKYFGTDPGMAALHDIALLSGMYGMFAGVVHAAALIRSANLKVTEFVPLLTSWLEAMTPQVPRFAEQIDNADYSNDVVSPLGMQAAAFENFTRTAEDQGIVPDLLVPVGTLMHRAVAAGHGNDDFASIVEVMRMK